MASKKESSGPGYCSPEDAMRGPREELIYVTCVQTPKNGETHPDYLAVVDVNPKSKTYCKIISRLNCGFRAELHHTGWNVCSSCHGDVNKKRDKLLLAGLKDSNIYIADVSEPKEPKMHKIIQKEELEKFGCTRPHTIHCGPEHILVSTLGDLEGNAKAEILMINNETFEVEGPWIKKVGDQEEQKINYDFWYQPCLNVMVVSEFGAPNAYESGFNPADVKEKNPEKYGRHLNFYNYKTRELMHRCNLGENGLLPLEVRFHHNPRSCIGYVGCALSSNIQRFRRDENGEWKVECIIPIHTMQIKNWVLRELPGLITDIIISMDDRYLYFSNWLQGDIRQYDISDPCCEPVLVGRIQIGGIPVKGSDYYLVDSKGNTTQLEPLIINGRQIPGGPQMLQLSLDGTRLYVTTSLYSTWDEQFYPEQTKNGACMIQIDVNTKKGGMKVNKKFLIDFGKEDPPVLAHEMRYPGGDCSSDIFLSNDCEECCKCCQVDKCSKTC